MTPRNIGPQENPDDRQFEVHLADYVQAELMGMNADELYPKIAFLIETSPDHEATYYREFRRQGLRRRVDELQRIGNRDKVAEVLEQILAPAWPANRIQEAIAKGRRWLVDAQQGVYLLFGVDMLARPAMAWAAKTTDPDQLLHQMTLDEETGTWEIEVSAFAGADDTCRVEVALFRPQEPDVELSDIPVIVRYGENMATEKTDWGGVAEFIDLPRAALETLVIFVEWGNRGR